MSERPLMSVDPDADPLFLADLHALLREYFPGYDTTFPTGQGRPRVSGVRQQ